MARLRKDPGVWGDRVINPGERTEIDLHIGAGYAGASVDTPVFVWRGEREGPSVFVTAAVHGDEINGTGAIRRIIRQTPFELVAGTLILVPVVNIVAFERHSRYLPDRRDLNRCFPGSTAGSLASRIARTVFDEIVSRADFGIDLHTAAVRRTNFPNVRADMSLPNTAGLARSFGAELIVSGAGPAGSFRRAATKAGCPTIILEAGEVWKVEPSVVEYAVRGVRNTLIALGMVEGDLVAPAFRLEADATQWIRAETSGFLRFHVAPGDIVDSGEPIATNSSLTGREHSVLTAPRSGVVLGMTTLPSVAAGDPVCHIAYVKDRALQRIELAVGQLGVSSLHERLRDDLSSSLLVEPAHPDAPSRAEMPPPANR